jgi:hypothetical protein
MDDRPVTTLTAELPVDAVGHPHEPRTGSRYSSCRYRVVVVCPAAALADCRIAAVSPVRGG